MAWPLRYARIVSRRTGISLGLAGRAAGPCVHDGLLGVEGQFAGSLLVLDVGAEGLVRLHRNCLCVLFVALDAGESVLAPKSRVTVAA